ADVTFDPGQLRVGRRLAVKILNASRFVLGLAPPGAGPDGDAGAAAAVTEPLDVAMLARLALVIGGCTGSLENFDHAGSLAAAEGRGAPRGGGPGAGGAAGGAAGGPGGAVAGVRGDVGDRGREVGGQAVDGSPGRRAGGERAPG